MSKTPLDELTSYFQKMPSVGNKSARRLAFFILSQPKSWVEGFSQAMKTVKEKIYYCSQCYTITMQDPCEICRDQGRDSSMLCVVADPKDQMVIEKMGDYKGLYHVLGGLISPIDGITPDILKIPELIKKLKMKDIKEVFFAINPTVEGEATILYITNLLGDYKGKLTRIAYGLPIGADMDYTDDLTLSKAYEGRIQIKR
jgi:recombination protein RecR